MSMMKMSISQIKVNNLTMNHLNSINDEHLCTHCLSLREYR